MKNLVIILGINGDLGKSIVNGLKDRSELSILGVDQQKTTPLPKILYSTCDLTDLEQITVTINAVDFKSFEKVILINVAGVFGKSSFQNDIFVDEVFYHSLAVNLVGVSRFIAHTVEKCLINKIKMRAVVVGSAAANVGSLDLGYGVAKAGLNGLVRSLSKAFAAKGITVIGVNPGVFESTMSQRVDSGRRERAIADTHIKRAGRLEEISEFVSKIAFEAPDFLTGSILPINGGQYS